MTAFALPTDAHEGPAAHQPPGSGTVAGAMAVIVIIWGLGPPVTKLISAPPLVSVSVRFWLSTPLVWAIAYATGRRMSVAILRRTALAGLLLGVNLAFVFTALQHASVAILAVTQALSPGIVLLVAGRWLGERATLWHVVWTGVAITGVAVVVLGGDPAVRGDTFGFILAVASMLTFTAYYLINRWVRSTTVIDPIQWMAGVTLFAGMAITPMALATSSPADYRQLGGADWLYLAFVAAVVGVLSHTLMSWAHKYIAASRSSLCLLAMNVVAIGVAWPLHDEPVTWTQVGGAVIVLGAVAAVLTRPALTTASTSPVPITSPPGTGDFDAGPPAEATRRGVEARPVGDRLSR